VTEAEFEDLSDQKREGAGRMAVTARTEGTSRETPAIVTETATSPLVATESAATLHGTVDSVGSDHQGKHAASKLDAAERRDLAEPVKAGKELDHDFFADGDEGAFQAGHGTDDVARRSHPEVDIDPQVLAALQARRDQGRRWATWIFGLALLLLVWGVFSIFGQRSDDDSVASGGALGAGAPSSAAVATAALPTPVHTAAADTTMVFEEVPPVNTASKLAPGAGFGLKPVSTLETPPDLAPLRPPRGKKPPTARFPSTPDNQ
jgi:hypothetical protein